MAGILPVLPDLVIFWLGGWCCLVWILGLDSRSSCWGVSSGSMAGDFVFCVCFLHPTAYTLFYLPPPHKGLGHLVLVRTAWGGSVLGGAGGLVQLPGVDALALGPLTFWSGWSLGCPSMHQTNAILSVTIFIQVPTLQLWMPL